MFSTQQNVKTYKVTCMDTQIKIPQESFWKINNSMKLVNMSIDEYEDLEYSILLPSRMQFWKFFLNEDVLSIVKMKKNKYIVVAASKGTGRVNVCIVSK